MKNLIEIKNLSYSYAGIGGQRANRVLNNVNISIQAQEFVAITGPSGSGKSTLINIIGLLTAPKEGHYSLLKTDVSSASERTREILRAKHIGFIFQDYLLLDHLTAFENVLLPLQYLNYPSQQKNQMAEEAMAKLGLAGFESRKPQQLSGGQKQRVAIARAIVNRPSLIIADEPGSALDPVNRTGVLRILQTLVADGSTVLMVTHSLEDAQVASRRIAIADGMIATDESRIGSLQLLQENPSSPISPLERFLAESGVFPIETLIQKVRTDWSIFMEVSRIRELPSKVWRDSRFAQFVHGNLSQLNNVSKGHLVRLLAEESLLGTKEWRFLSEHLAIATLTEMSDGALASLIAHTDSILKIEESVPFLLSHGSALVRAQCLSKLKSYPKMVAHNAKLITNLCSDPDTRVRCGAMECLDSQGLLPEIDFSLNHWQSLAAREWSILLRWHLKNANCLPIIELRKGLCPIWKTEDKRLILSTYYALSVLPENDLIQCIKDMLADVPSLAWLAKDVGQVVQRGGIQALDQEEAV